MAIYMPVIPKSQRVNMDAVFAGLAKDRKAAAKKGDADADEKPEVSPASRTARARAALKKVAPAKPHKHYPKESVCTSGAYMAAVRKLGRCLRCGWVPPPDRKGAIQFCHRDEGKGLGIKTDVRDGWAGCAGHDGGPGCHYIVGTSGKLSKEQRRQEDDQLGELTRQAVDEEGLWPPSVPRRPGDPKLKPAAARARPASPAMKKGARA